MPKIGESAVAHTSCLRARRQHFRHCLPCEFGRFGRGGAVMKCCAGLLPFSTVEQWIPNFRMVGYMRSHSPLQGLVLPSSAKAGFGQGIHQSILWAQNWYRLLARSFSFADNWNHFFTGLSWFIGGILAQICPMVFPRLNPWTACWKDVDVSPPARCWEAWSENVYNDVVSAETKKKRLLRPCLVLRLLDPAAWLLREKWDRTILNTSRWKNGHVGDRIGGMFWTPGFDGSTIRRFIQTGIHFTYFATL